LALAGVVVSFTPLPLNPWGKNYQNQLDRRLAGSQSRYGSHGEVTVLDPTDNQTLTLLSSMATTASDSNIQVLQRYQNKALKCIVNAPWYVRNSNLHSDLRIETVTDITAKFVNSHEKRLRDHINIKASRLLNVINITRRRKQNFRIQNTDFRIQFASLKAAFLVDIPFLKPNCSGTRI
jgi:hypothetical protein